MRLGIDVRVDAQGDAGCLAEAGGNLAQRVELGLRLDIEAVDALAQGIGHLLPGLADAGKDDAIGGHACGPGAAQLAFRHHVHAGAQARQGGNHGLVGVGLDGVADEGVQPGERLLQHAVVPLQRGGAVAVERRAHRAGDVCQTHVLRVEDPAAVGEMVHGRPVSGSTGRVWRACAGPGVPGVPGVAPPVSVFSFGGASSEPRTPQPGMLSIPATVRAIATQSGKRLCICT